MPFYLLARFKILNMNRFIAIIILLIFISCKKENTDIKEGTGTIWLSGGLAFCAEQIHLDRGDTLIPVYNTNLLLIRAKLTSEDRVKIRYKELTTKELGCKIGMDCEVIELVKLK